MGRLAAKAGANRLREPQPPANRYEHDAPGDLLHLDIKKLNRYLKNPGHRVDGDRTRRRSRGSGTECVHVAIGDHSRLSVASIEPDETADSACNALLAAFRRLRLHGIRPRRPLTDNGSAYRSRKFARLCRRLGLRHTFTRPYTPRTNGKAERSYNSSTQRADCLEPWLHHYSWHRPHTSLGRQPPISGVPLTQYNVVELHR